MYSKADSETELSSSGLVDDDVQFRDNDDADRGRFAVVRISCMRTYFVSPTIHRYHIMQEFNFLLDGNIEPTFDRPR